MVDYVTLHYCTMAYNEEKDIASGSSSRHSMSDDSESLPLTENEQKFAFRPRHQPWRAFLVNDSPFWKFYSIFMTAVALILLVTMVHRAPESKDQDDSPATDHKMLSLEHAKPSPADSNTEPHHSQSINDPLDGYPLGVESYEEANIVTTKFYKDLRYMTLDHESDYLWEEHLHMVTGNIKLPPTEENGNSSLKAIAMYAVPGAEVKVDVNVVLLGSIRCTVSQQ
jgi:hypothetical protein